MVEKSIPEFFHQLLKVRMAFRRVMISKLKENNLDLTFEMLQIIHALWLKEGESQQTLAMITVRDKASVTCLLNNLEKRGLVERRVASDDGRSRLIYLSEKGETLSRVLKPIAQEVYDYLEDKIGKTATQWAVNYLEGVYEELEKI